MPRTKKAARGRPTVKQRARAEAHKASKKRTKAEAAGSDGDKEDDDAAQPAPAPFKKAKTDDALHCVRCHKSFMTSTNAEDACTIDAFHLRWENEDQDGNLDGSCLGCGWTGKVTGDGELPRGGGVHRCFKGRHTTDVSEVRYGGEGERFQHVVTCQVNQCPSA